MKVRLIRNGASSGNENAIEELPAGVSGRHESV
jgi:hypothetical protein